jgi:hypothetical protein
VGYLAKSQRDQAGAKQDKTGNGYGQETVGGELVTHDGDSRLSNLPGQSLEPFTGNILIEDQDGQRQQQANPAE